MKPFRKSSLRGKIIDVFSQLVIVAISCLFCLWMISGAKAANLNQFVSIKESQQNDSHEFELQFQKKIDRNKIKSEFDRDFFQFSIQDASIFPAKNIGFKNELIKGSFAYQYQPHLARIRLYINVKKTNELKKNLNWTVDGNKILIYLHQDTLASANNQIHKDEIKNSISSVEKTKKIAASDDVSLSKEEEQLLQDMQKKFTENKTVTPKATNIENKVTAKNNNSESVSVEKEKGDLFSGMKRDGNKNASITENKKVESLSFSKIFSSLAIVLLILLGVSLLMKKFFIQSPLNLKGNQKMIQTITNLNLSPGKSISIIRVGEEYLLLGITGNSINLLKELEDFSEVSSKGQSIDKPIKSGKKNIFQSVFSKSLSLNDKNEEVITNKQLLEEGSDFRESIKNRIKGYKQLV